MELQATSALPRTAVLQTTNRLGRVYRGIAASVRQQFAQPIGKCPPELFNNAFTAVYLGAIVL